MVCKFILNVLHSHHRARFNRMPKMGRAKLFWATLILSNFVRRLCLSCPLLLSFSYKALAVDFLQKLLRRMPFYREETSPEKSFRELLSSRKLSGENDVIFTGPKFYGFWETRINVFGSFTGHFPGPNSLRDFWETHARSGRVSRAPQYLRDFVSVK